MQQRGRKPLKNINEQLKRGNHRHPTQPRQPQRHEINQTTTTPTIKKKASLPHPLLPRKESR